MALPGQEGCPTLLSTLLIVQMTQTCHDSCDRAMRVDCQACSASLACFESIIHDTPNRLSQMLLRNLLHLAQIKLALYTAESTANVGNLSKLWGICSRYCDEAL